MNAEREAEQKGPVFLLVDDDRAAADAIAGKLFPEYYYVVQVTNPRHVRNFARRLAPRAIFLAEPIVYPKGGAEALLRRLVDELRTPVVILSEVWSQEEAQKWKERGAVDCIPHPTRQGMRLERLRAMMQAMAFEQPGELLPLEGEAHTDAMPERFPHTDQGTQ